MATINEKPRYALFEGEQQLTDYIWWSYESLDDYIILTNAQDIWIYNRENKKITAKIKGELCWYSEDDGYAIVKENWKYGVYSFDGNIILPVEFSGIEENKSYFVVKDMSNLCGVFSIKGENIVPISFESIGCIKMSEDKETINVVSVIMEGTKGWYIVKRNRFVPVDAVNITKTGIVEVRKGDEWYILDDTDYLNIIHKPNI